MKQLRTLVCTALIALCMGGEAHAAMWFQAKGAVAHDQRFRNQGNSGGDRDSGQGRNNGGDRQQWNGGGGWDEDRGDNRAARAKAAVSGKGRVLDVGQESGSVFWVVVSTDHGRVTYLVNADTGRIVGER